MSDLPGRMIAIDPDVPGDAGVLRAVERPVPSGRAPAKC
jgi:hypothetical protein